MATMHHCAKCRWRIHTHCYVYGGDPLLGVTRCSGSEAATCCEFRPVRVTRAKTVQTRTKHFETGKPLWTPFPLRELRPWRYRA